MKYKIEITFDTSKKLSDKELDDLQDSLMLQIFEPTDSDGNDSDWRSSNIFMHTKKGVQ